MIGVRLGRGPSRIVVAGLVLLAAGCAKKDPRLEKLTAGISKDSVLVIMGIDKPARVDPYLVGGHYIEAMYYPMPGDEGAAPPDRKMSPLVVIDGKLAGWGWDLWDSTAGANKIQVAPKD